jgi:hypothetical protein
LPIKSAVAASNLNCLTHTVGSACFLQIIAAHDLKPLPRAQEEARAALGMSLAFCGVPDGTVFPIRRLRALRDKGADDFP